MRGYLALIDINIKLAMREKVVLFFNFLFPLIFFFAFGQMMDASMGGVGVRVVSMVLVLGVLGNGLFGGGIRPVVERETNILRRYKVTPISAAPILVASIVTGWLLYLPVILMILGLAWWMWGVELPQHWISLLVLLSVGAWAMRAIGLIVASVVNSAAESNIVIQLLYMPMLFLSGATFPISVLPDWAQVVAQFLPASYLQNGMERIMIRGESLGENLTPVFALLVSTVAATLISVKIFRWEKEQTLPARAKLWLVVVGIPFILLGVYQSYSRENINDSLALERDVRRNRTRLIRGSRIFVGDGTVIESGGVLLKNGRIAKVYDGAVPDPKSLNAEVVEAAGKTVLPGLIDAHIHLGAPGGVPPNTAAFDFQKSMERSLGAYLYCGVTAVRSAGDAAGPALAIKRKVEQGTLAGAELFVGGPLFTTEGGYGAEGFKNMPEAMRRMAEREFLRLPGSSAEAREMVRALAVQGVDAIEVILDSGSAEMLFNRVDVNVLNAIAEETRAHDLPLLVHTGDNRDIADALDAGANAIEHGSSRDEIPGRLLARMMRQGVTYDPALVAGAALAQLSAGRFDLLTPSLVEQVAPPGMIEATKKAHASPKLQEMRGRLNLYEIAMDTAAANLRRAYEAGATLVAGSDSGNPLLIHGPAIHRELQLWVKAGVPPAVALEAATHNAAVALGAGGRIGLVREGYDATLLLVDGNPLEDISATERISIVFFKGERMNRVALIEKE